MSVLISIAAPLAAVVAALPRLTLLLAALGRPFSSAGFANWCRNRGNEANLPPCSAHTHDERHEGTPAASGPAHSRMAAAG